MRPAVWPRSGARLLHLEPASGRLSDYVLSELPELMHPGDLLVVNDAATLPASFQAKAPGGAVELRLASWWAPEPFA